ncbi:Transcriptional adapter 2-beta [Holothuria leucospilota]|uniref:Transcriptional adapter 2-beta n=1 Tax=Holothuria leucospilota TaxID=206669 RepID=A0A9Q1HH49_HOLLE|nr:Transcriptional adapter 2-beta [Holothuria leucospilota]
MAEVPTRFYCNNCQVELRACSIKCDKCVDFDLCLQCFVSGAELGTHKRDHDYQITDNSLFSRNGNSNWSMSDEYALLDGVEAFGYGNWEATANHIGTKGKEEVKDHYARCYVDANIGAVTLPKVRVNKVIDHTCSDDGPLSPSLSNNFEPVELPITEQHELGYMPLRDDFERESNNDAEKIISHLEVSADDDEQDEALKEAHVDMYTRALKERLRRKKLAREYGLIAAVASTVPTKSKKEKDKDKEKEVKKKPSKEEIEFKEKLRPFSPCISLKDVEDLYSHVQKEKQTKSRIRELIKYRKFGIKKLSEVEKFEEMRAKHEKKKELKKKLVEKNKKPQILAAKRIDIKEETKKEDTEEIEDNFYGLRSSHGFKYLSDRERKLCNSMRMKPARYITLKGLIIKDHSLRRQGIQTKTKYPSNLDKGHRKRIVNFLVKSGWIKVS